MTFWRTSTAILTIATVALWWQNCNLRAQNREASKNEKVAVAALERQIELTGPRPRPTREATIDAGTEAVEGERMALPVVPLDVRAIAAELMPIRGENLLDYRDRVVPRVSQLAAPHRARVRRNLDQFAAEAGLDREQLAELDRAVEDASTHLRDRVLEGVMSGELMPPFRAAPILSVGRELITIADDVSRNFREGLRPDQLDLLAQSRFDPIDYFVFTAPWEQLLGVGGGLPFP